MSVNSLRMGIYRHYKGPLYQVLGLGHDADNGDRTVVVYIALQLDGAHLGPRIAVRTIEGFEDVVHVAQARDNWPVCPGLGKCSLIKNNEGNIDLDHYERLHRNRFVFLGPELTSDMLEPVLD